jgi:hypothetical protein
MVMSVALCIISVGDSLGMMNCLIALGSICAIVQWARKVYAAFAEKYAISIERNFVQRRHFKT